jgi:hypothetical protein
MRPFREDRTMRQSRRTLFWWLYLAGLLAHFAVTTINYVVEGFFSTLWGMLVTWAFLSFDLLCMAGLYAYLRSLPVFTNGLWRVLVLLLAVRVTFVMPLFVFQLHPWNGTTEQYVALFALVSLLYFIPLLWALWSYAFRSPQLWRAAPRAA